MSFDKPCVRGWVIRLHRKFYSGAAKKLPVKGLKNLHVIPVYVKQTLNYPLVFVRPASGRVAVCIF